jgi:hypothetical protein
LKPRENTGTNAARGLGFEPRPKEGVQSSRKNCHFDFGHNTESHGKSSLSAEKRTLLECTCETSRAAARTPERLQTIRLFHSSTQTGEHCFTCPNVGQTQRPFWTTHGNPNALINHPFIHWIFGVGASILDGWHGVNMQGLCY